MNFTHLNIARRSYFVSRSLFLKCLHFYQCTLCPFLSSEPKGNSLVMNLCVEMNYKEIRLKPDIPQGVGTFFLKIFIDIWR